MSVSGVSSVLCVPDCLQQVLPPRQCTAEVSHCVSRAQSMPLIKKGNCKLSMPDVWSTHGSLLPSKSTLSLSVLFSLVASYIVCVLLWMNMSMALGCSVKVS